MNAQQMWLGGIIVVLSSIWIGLQIGVNRDWLAGIFLYVVPAITLTSLIVVTLRSKADKKADFKKKEDIQVIHKQLKELQEEIYKINQSTKNVDDIKKKIDLLEDKISTASFTFHTNNIENDEL